MSNAMKVAIAGCGGRMGRMLLECIPQVEGLVLGGAFEREGSSLLGADCGELAGQGANGIKVGAGVESLPADIDVVVDFTAPAATLAAARWCAAHGARLVVGTTGFSDAQKAELKQLSAQVPMVIAANYSVGVNLLLKLLQTAAKVMGDYTDIEIIEGHHRFKVDAPSGTALRMGEVIAETLGRDLKQVAVYGREGITGERDRKTIGFATIRGGDLIGEHTAMFADIGERVEITHKASSRATFATGALRAAVWLKKQQPAIYDMQDVLELKI